MVVEEKSTTKGVGDMEVEYFYCSSCSYEDFNTKVSYSRTCASGDLVYCPHCGEESYADEKSEVEGE